MGLAHAKDFGLCVLILFCKLYWYKWGIKNIRLSENGFVWLEQRR